jgi:hypothetical protein
MANTYEYKPPPRNVNVSATGDVTVSTKEVFPSKRSKKSITEKAKSRIYQKFPHSIQLDELSIPAKDKDGKNKLESLASLEYPLIKINDYIISDTEIDVMKLDCTGFMPRITLTCTFTHQTFVTREMPKDGDIISIAIRNKSDLLKSIRNDYVITGVLSSANSGLSQTSSTLTFFGMLFVPGMMSSKGKFSYNGTSFDTMRAYAAWLKLGFATNEDDTDDKQIWIYTKYGKNDLDFPENVTAAAYKDDVSFYSIWIDVYYNLNFVNINKQLMTAENEVDIAAWINNIDKDFIHGENTKQSKTVEAAKVLSNYTVFKTSSFFINSWKPNNRSSSVTFQVGTKTWCQTFEHNNSYYANSDRSKFHLLEMEPTYDPNKVNRYILLRGRATQDPSTRGKELARANYDYTEIYARYPWMGIQYTVSNPDDENLNWDGNHHRNYYRAKVQNTINNKELEKLNLEIDVNGLNLNIIRGDKIPVALIKTDPIENKIINKDVERMDMLDQFYSGWFIVKGFNITYNKENSNSIMSNFTQSFVLTRREWPPPIAVEAIPKPTNQNNV